MTARLMPDPSATAGPAGGEAGRLRAILETAITAVVSMDGEGRVVDWNPQAEATFGWRAEEVCGRRLSETVVPPQYREAHERGIARFLATGEGPVLGTTIEITALHSDGREFPVELAISPPVREGGGLLFVAFVRDITERRREELLRRMQFEVTRILSSVDETDMALRTVLATIAQSLNFSAANLWDVEPEGLLRCRLGWADDDPAFAGFQAASEGVVFPPGVGLPGIVVATGQATTVADVVSLDNFPRHAAAIDAGLHGAVAFPVTTDGRTSGVLEFFTPERTPLAPEIVAAMGDLGSQIAQFGERRRAEAALRASIHQLTEIAATDPLTGLRNRREFERMLASIPRRPFGVVAVDVDHLKRVNDEFGHEAGDSVLRAIAMTLSSVVRGWDLVARIGGDEFCAVLLDADEHEVEAAAERMRTAVRSVSVPFGTARVSVGWATAPAGSEPMAVWRTADEHLYRAKQRGRDLVVGARANARATPKIPVGSQWAERVEEVLATRTLSTVYQPVVRLDDGVIVGHEALARPAGSGPLSSVEGFFAAAQRTGRMRDVDWLCRRLAIERAPWPPEWLLFLNVSTMALLDPVHDVDQMLLLLEHAGGHPDQVILEITEHEQIKDLERLRWVLSAYREHGFRFAVDDVGEGHSTLELLAAASPEFLKIARSLTTTATRSGSRAAIRAAVAFARDSGALVLAEGIENPIHADQMVAMGVTLGQGFHTGGPVPASALRVPHPRRRRSSLDVRDVHGRHEAAAGRAAVPDPARAELATS